MAGPKRKTEEFDEATRTKRKKTTPAVSVRITRQMATDAPRKAVFNTTELLEHVLSFLPPRNLFGFQRVSRQFKDLIATSVRLQRRLGVKASVDDDSRQYWTPIFDSKTHRRNFSAFARVAPEARHGKLQVVPVNLNFPLTRYSRTAEEEANSAVRFRQNTEREVVVFDTTHGMELTGAHSWHDIRLTDWPTPNAFLELRWEIREGVYGVMGRSVYISGDERAVTLGMLMTEALDTLELDEDGYSWWHDRKIRGVTPLYYAARVVGAFGEEVPA